MISPMRARWIVTAIQSAICAGPGLVAGIVAGGSAILFAQSTAERAEMVARIYWALVVLMPIGVWLSHDIRSFGANGRLAYATPFSALVTSGVAGLVGAFLGGGPLFLLGSINMPIVLAGEDATAYSLAVRSAISQQQFILVLAATMITALVLGILSYRQVVEYE
ncbi:MAG: hypothetical protein KF893_21830 [Caldilineaceae bacterium]|nr:hypothetical protein [Caldilineaceae bacterium]